MTTELEDNLRLILAEKITKIIPENIKADVNILGITGTYEGSNGIKQFSTIEEMQADTEAKEGDLAVVYRSEIQNATVDSHFQTATFPDTVVLDTAITDYVDIRYRAVDSSVMFDCMGSLESSRFNMNCYTESGNIRIEYTSEDGITYTRTDTQGNPVDFGTEIYYEMAEMWNDAIGKFIQIGGSTFEGLYKYSESNWSLAPTQLTAIPEYVYGKEFYSKNGAEQGTLQNTEGLSKEQLIFRVDIWQKFKNLSVADTDLSGAFWNYEGETIPNIDTSNVTNMSNMFYGCTNLTELPELNTSNVVNMSNMFNNCTNLKIIPQLNTSNVTNMSGIFVICKSLETLPLLDTSNVTDMSYFIEHCTLITSLPLFNTSNVTNMQEFARGCKALKNFPALDTSNVTNMSGIFENCESLETLPLLDTSNVTDMFQTFTNCTSLTSIPLWDLSKVKNIESAFFNCSALVNIPQFNLASATNMSYMFYGCTNLSDESLNNILAMCTNATSANTKTLKYIRLTSEQATKCTTLSNYQAFLDAGWTTGY